MSGDSVARRSDESSRRGEAASAGVQLALQEHQRMCERRVQERRDESILQILHDTADDECAFPVDPLHDIRVDAGEDEQGEKVQPNSTHGVWRSGWRCGFCCHESSGRVQDTAEHTRSGCGEEIQDRRDDTSNQNHLPVLWMERILPGTLC